MAYTTGTAATIPDLLDAIVTFLNANGWTQDSFIVESTGKRYHAHRSGVYVNFKSRVNENWNLTTLAYDWVANQASSGIAMYLSSGYNGANSWYDQPGRPVGNPAASQRFPIAGLPSYQPYGSVNYHFFAHNSGDNIVLTVEFIPNHYCHIAFGVTVDKRGQTYNGGEYFMANHSGYGWSPQGQWENTTGGYHVGTDGIGEWTSGAAQSRSWMRIEVDGDAIGQFGAGWRGVNGNKANASGQTNTNASGYLAAAARYVFLDTDEYISQQRYFGNSPLNNIILLTPLKLYVTRNTTNSSYPNAHSFIGEIPKILAINIRNLNVGQQISIGGINYRVFPMNGSKLVGSFSHTSPGGTGTQTAWGTGEYGYAIEE